MQVVLCWRAAGKDNSLPLVGDSATADLDVARVPLFACLFPVSLQSPQCAVNRYT